MNASKSGRKSQFKLFFRRFCRNKLAVFGLIFIVFIILVALFAPFIAPYGYDDQNVSIRLTKPNSEHWFGTDDLGRDVFSRMIYGARVSLSVGISTTAISMFTALIIGMISGYYGGRTDNIIMRIVDVFLAIPSILLSIAIAATLGGGIVSMLIALSMGAIPGVSRLIRAQVMAECHKEYVEAAKVTRASDFRIMFKYIFPNILSVFIVTFTMGVAGGILNASMLSFIGLGAQPPIPEWGAMLSEGRAYIRDYPYLVTYPGIMISITVFAINMFGDGLRDAFDPKLKGR
ncbi:MAG: ABC transporter permease [Clostridiaceae bacterium]|nr:ABC transporter permease [Clostridiaceae bacterium]